MNRKALRILPWALLALIAVYYAAVYGLARLGYPLEDVTVSPDGRYRIFNFQTTSDGLGHAPYGTNLSLTRKHQIYSPEDGYVIFGGYCKNDVGVEWKGKTHVIVYCESTDPARTRVVLAYGIEIEYVNGRARSNNSLQADRP